MNSQRAIWILVTLAVLIPVVCNGDEFPFTPTIDLYIDRDNADAKVNDNFLDIGDGQGGSGQDDRALTKFNFSAIAGSAVNTATLRLNQVELGNDDRFGNAQVRRVGTMDWDGTEAGSTLYSLARDANTAVLGNFSLATNPAAGPKSVDITSTVDGWVDGSLSNFGLSLVQTSEGFTDTQRRFVSGNAGGTAVTVDFTPTSAGPMVATLSPTIDLYIDDSAGFAKVDSNQLNIGHAAGGNTGEDDRALFKFDLSSLNGATIHAATLTLNQEELGNADQFGIAQLRAIGTSDWDGSETGLALYDLAGDSNTVVLQNFSPAQDPPAGPYYLDLTMLVQEWSDGTTPNFGLSLLQASEGFGNTGRQFTSGDADGLVLSVLFTQVVPEPASIAIWTLLGLALSAFGYYRARRNK